MNLKPEVEESLIAQAHARGLSLNEYLQELIAKEAGVATGREAFAADRRFQNLSDLLQHSPLSGADLDLERLKDYPRPTEIG